MFNECLNFKLTTRKLTYETPWIWCWNMRTFSRRLSFYGVDKKIRSTIPLFIRHTLYTSQKKSITTPTHLPKNLFFATHLQKISSKYQRKSQKYHHTPSRLKYGGVFTSFHGMRLLPRPKVWKIILIYFSCDNFLSSIFLSGGSCRHCFSGFSLTQPNFCHQVCSTTTTQLCPVHYAPEARMARYSNFYSTRVMSDGSIIRAQIEATD